MQNIPPSTALEFGDFSRIFNSMISARQIDAIGAAYHSGLGAPPKTKLSDLVLGSVGQQLQGIGTRAQNLQVITGQQMSESAISERFQLLPSEVFEQIMDVALKPQAHRRRNPEAFYKGLRLVGIDGVKFPVANTAAVTAQMKKAGSRRGQAAFAHVGMTWVSELAIHHPIAVAIGEQQESEMELARLVLAKLSSKILLLGDRYYGVGKFLMLLMLACLDKKIHFLFRARANLKPRMIRRLADGSALMEVNATDGSVRQVREIRGRVLGRERRWIEVRLWTNLFDERRHPAAELLELYSRRWEQEIATDELKNKLHRRALLKSQTPRTAVQELAALMMAQSILTQIRMVVAQQAKVPTLRASFAKTRHYMQGLWLVIENGQGILSQKQIHALANRTIQRLTKLLTPPRRKRSCPRAVRQPVSPWPRLMTKISHSGSFLYKITPIK